MTENVGSELTSSFTARQTSPLRRPLQRPGPGRRADLAARARHGHAARAGIQSDRAITTIMTDIKAELPTPTSSSPRWSMAQANQQPRGRARGS